MSTPKNMKQKMIELQREIDESTRVDGDFNIPVSVPDRSSRWKNQ